MLTESQLKTLVKSDVYKKQNKIGKQALRLDLLINLNIFNDAKMSAIKSYFPVFESLNRLISGERQDSNAPFFKNSRHKEYMQQVKDDLPELLVLILLISDDEIRKGMLKEFKAFNQLLEQSLKGSENNNSQSLKINLS
jgi:hypothetical protein